MQTYSIIYKLTEGQLNHDTPIWAESKEDARAKFLDQCATVGLRADVMEISRDYNINRAEA